MSEGNVVCGCFRRRYNPDAPGIVLASDLRRMIEPAERFCRQSFPVPIFLCESDGAGWFYQGDYEVESWTTNLIERKLHGERSHCSNISRVIFLRSAPG